MSSDSGTIEIPTASSEVPPVAPKPKILIGSQRNPEAYRPAPTVLVVPETPPEDKPQTATYPPDGVKPESVKRPNERREKKEILLDDNQPDHLSIDGLKKMQTVGAPPKQRVAVPKFRNGKMDADLTAEFDALFAEVETVKEMLEQTEQSVDHSVIEPDTTVQAKVIEIQKDHAFLDIGAREQGIVAMKFFPPDAEPKVGDEITVTVLRLVAEDGYYDVSVPLAAADVRDWSQVHEGLVVEALIMKTNNGGLECEVNRLRGFIPISQIELFRVENTEEYVGKKLTCVVEEVNPERRNLVLSRKSLLLREREEKRQQLMSELAVGQSREGFVRKIIDTGAFVDLGGVDGFIPISQMAWGRINHPSDVLKEGSTVVVNIARIEEKTNRISLVYRDASSNPWTNITENFPIKTIVRGKVSKIMEFGAFVELAPGLEGLIHISELSGKRVANTREAVQEGEWVNVMVLSIDTSSQRIALSLRQAQESPKEEAQPEITAAAKTETAPPKPAETYGQKGQLKGGTAANGGSSNLFGLKW